MILHSKGRNGEAKLIQRIVLVDRSVLIMGWRTNREWSHQIKRDRRANRCKRPDELRNGGERISITLRSIATFQRRREDLLFGQGAFYKTEAELDAAIAADGIEAIKARFKDTHDQRRGLLHAFNAEDKDACFDWHHCYGRGFSVIAFDPLSTEDAAIEKDSTI
jgi:hypothetical protein